MDILTFPDPILRTKTSDIQDVRHPDITTLYQTMITVMHTHGGIGLAANQIGLNLSMFVTRFGETPRVFFNPTILEYPTNVVIGTEGCLSLPGVRGEVERSETIWLLYTNTEGMTKEELFTGYMARIIQHEIDHLNGLYYFDRMSESNRQEIIEKYLSINR